MCFHSLSQLDAKFDSEMLGLHLDFTELTVEKVDSFTHPCCSKA